MRVAYGKLVDRWRDRLRSLNTRRQKGDDVPWRLRIERRILQFLLSRHDPDEGGESPQHSQPLDAASAESARRLRLSDEARERLGPDSAGTMTHASRGFRSEDELESLEAEAQRRDQYKKRLARRSALMILFFLLLLLWIGSTIVITRWLDYW